MAIKTQNVSLDFLKVGVIKDALLNPLTTSARNTLAATLGAGNVGLPVYDTDLFTIFVWDGSDFTANPVTQSGLTPKGNKAFNDTEPASPVIGDLYVFTTAGSNTWEGTNVVQIGDQVYWDGSAWQFIQGNVIAASDTVAGIVELATDAETNTGTDTTRAITPANLAANHASRKSAKVYFATGITTVANTPLTINHALALQNRDAFVLSFKVSNSEVEVDVDSTDTNNCTITTNVAATGTITVIGF
jgi:hypothetical protein